MDVKYEKAAHKIVDIFEEDEDGVGLEGESLAIAIHQIARVLEVIDKLHGEQV